MLSRVKVMVEKKNGIVGRMKNLKKKLKITRTRK